MSARSSYRSPVRSGAKGAIIVLALMGIIALYIQWPRLVSDLLVHLPLNDSQTGTIAEDNSGNGNDGAISGATYVPVGDGSAFSLDFEDGDSVNLGGLDVNGTGITLAAWVRADSFTGSGFDGRIISKADGIAAKRHVFMLSTTRRGATDDVVLRGRVRIRGETITIRANRGVMLPGIWYHTAMVFDGSTMKLYLDGVEVANVPFTPPLVGMVDRDRKVDVSVGAQPDGLAPWDGQIKDVYIAQSVFSAAEIAALATNNPGLVSDLLVHLPLDDNQTGAIAEDKSGNGNDGAISGATYVPTGDGSVFSLEFEDGDSVDLGGLDVSGTGITLAAWVKADSFTGDRFDGRIISKADGIAANRHVFMLSTARRSATDDVVLQGRVRIDGEAVTIRAGKGLMLPGIWYHTAMVYDGLTMKLYLDGNEVASNRFIPPLVGMVDRDSDIDVSVGSQPDGRAPWDGLIDDVHIAQRVFSAAEIASLAASNPGLVSDLLVQLPLDDNQTEAIAKDSSGNGNDGVISGATYVSGVDDSAFVLDFEGGDSVNLGGLNVNGTGLTLAAWVRADSFTGRGLDGRIVSKADGIAANRHVFMLSTTRRGSTDDVVLRGRVRIGGQAVTVRANRGIMLPGIWYHTAMVYDESTMTLYLDGVEVANVPFTAPLVGRVDQDSDIDVSVGAQPDGLAFWDGQMRQVYIAQRAYSAAEIAALATDTANTNSFDSVLMADGVKGAVLKEAPQITPGLLLRDTVFVLKDGVNMREGPSTSHPIVLQLDSGHELLEIKRDGDWVRVEDYGASSKIGWVYSRLVGDR